MDEERPPAFNRRGFVILFYPPYCKNANRVLGRVAISWKERTGMESKKYQEALDYLFGLLDGGIKLGLENTQKLLAHFGDPHLKVPTIHIGGTNGKGSTAAFTQSILQATGHRVGLFTSPHLLDIRERYRINQSLIEKDEFAELIHRLRRAAEKLAIAPTFFEFGTVLAFLYFYEKKVDWNVIEVGLGGRLDSTNLCRPEIAILTSIDLDHTQYLGEDLEAIAKEKAFIIKESGTVFAHIEHAGAKRVIRQAAHRQGAKLYCLGEDFSAQIRSHAKDGQSFDFLWDNMRMQELSLPLIGRHQVSNAALAVAACTWLGQKTGAIDEQSIRLGLNNTRWPGRLEVIDGHPQMVLDCAHNPAGVRNLTLALQENFKFARCILILGIMKDKPVEEMLGIFAEIADHWIFTRPRQERSMAPGELAKTLAHTGISKTGAVETIDSMPEAIKRAQCMAGPNDLICIAGSIFTVAEAKQALAHE